MRLGVPLRFRLAQKQKMLLVDHECRVVAYPLDGTTPRDLYVPDNGWQVAGYALSTDEEKLAVALRLGDYPGGSEAKLVVVDIASDAQTASVPIPISPWLPLPLIWSPDDDLMYLQGTAPRDGGGSSWWVVRADGSDLRPMADVVSRQYISPDGGSYGYSGNEKPTEPFSCSVLWGRPLQVLTLASQEVKSHWAGAETWFHAHGWSPDSKQLLYSTRRSPEGTCPDLASNPREESFLWDTAANRHISIPSWQAQLTAWAELTFRDYRLIQADGKPLEGDITAFWDAFGRLTHDGEILLRGKVVDEGRIRFAGTLTARP